MPLLFILPEQIMTLLQKEAFTAERAGNAEYFYGFVINEAYYLRFG
jgi:hypothetical protein